MNGKNQTSADSAGRVLSLSRLCPDFPENRVRCLSAVRILPGFSVRCLSVRILSVSILLAVRIQLGILKKMLMSVCPKFSGLNSVRCPELKKSCTAGQGRNRLSELALSLSAVPVLVRRW